MVRTGLDVTLTARDEGHLNVSAEHPLSHGVGFDRLPADQALEMMTQQSLGERPR